jgi:succinoglycan biosynthesis protein ExoO
MTPIVSVVIPAYNTEKYIGQAIESVLAQTEQNFEVIVVDDASTDTTVDVVKRFADARIKLLVNERNRGVCYSRNRAIQTARGEWIALLDADDWYGSPQRLERLLDVAQAENADLIADDVYFIEDGQKHPSATLLSVGKQFNEPKKIDAIAFIESHMKPARYSPHLGLTKPIIKYSFLLQNKISYNEKLAFVEDLYFYLLCLTLRGNFIIVPEPYYCYRRTNCNSITSQKSRLKQLELIRTAVLDFLQQEAVQKNPDIQSHTLKYLALVERNLNYHRAVQPLKEQGLLATAIESLRQPQYFALLLGQVPNILYRRILHYFGKTQDI